MLIGEHGGDPMMAHTDDEGTATASAETDIRNAPEARKVYRIVR